MALGLFDGMPTHIKAERSDTQSNAIDSESLGLLRAWGSGSADPTLNTASTTTGAASDHQRILPIGGSLQLVGIRARDVRAVVQEQHPETVFTRRDIYNARASINCDKLGGYTPTAALIKLFDENKIPYLVKWADNNSNRLVGLVWTFPYCLQMWKRFPEVMSFDNTYNTNRFKLPLFQATGQTCLGSVYNAAFGLIDNEKREGFQFLSESIRQLAEQHLIRQPDVIITDFDDAMKAALNDQFPEAQQQLCIHHIISNVLLKAKQKWVTDREPHSSGSSVDDCDGETASAQTHSKLSPKDRRCIHEPVAEDIPHSYHGVLMMWKHVMFAETEEAHEKAWCDLCREFDDQRAILRYLHGTYMPVRAQWARCFIRKYRNFGIRVTSGTEASNNNVKSYLLNGMSNLHRLVEAIQDMIRDQERDFAHASAEDEVLTARGHIGSSSDDLQVAQVPETGHRTC
ncbi:mutator-like element [Purpureocillium lavendulum]|uniref:Mutator-like element n=1 Tax=Purpureocillium lavendulum TaxID=1247861 RepID=A0AB34FGI2_9HYPO|nr:mutator-like element [Purpureocillium lavendulum]